MAKAQPLANGNFNEITCKKLLVKHGQSIVIELRADLHGGAEANFLGQNDVGEQINVLAVNVFKDNTILLRFNNQDGDLKKADLLKLLPDEPGPPPEGSGVEGFAL